MEIKANKAVLRAVLKASQAVKCVVSFAESITVSISIPQRSSVAYYDGAYTVIPRADRAVTLQTQGYAMRENVTTVKIPYYETSNTSGSTVYIADEVD